MSQNGYLNYLMMLSCYHVLHIPISHMYEFLIFKGHCFTFGSNSISSSENYSSIGHFSLKVDSGFPDQLKT